MARSVKTLLCLILVVVMMVGCNNPTINPTEPTEPDPLAAFEQRLEQYKALGTGTDDNYRTWYEIFVYSFCDSNGDGIGDLQGVISKLDYLQELGINGIWLMPIHPSTSYHKYNVDDYYAIDPTYGTMEDFNALSAECDRRDIKLILDLVVNHSGDQNPWFTTACDYLKNLMLGEEMDESVCPEVGYYNFTLESGQSGFRKIPGSDYYYECQFSGDMPDLKLENENLRKNIEDIMRFWMDKGVDGFRLDAAKEFYTGNITKNVEVLAWLQKAATAIKPDAYLVAEVWDGFAAVTRYYESGLTSIFNYPFGDNIGKLATVVNNRGNANMVTTWATALQKANEAYSGSHPDYIDAPFLSNHDVGRIYDFVKGDPLRVKMAGALNIFMSGSVFIYYGEEIGMAGTIMEGNDNDPSKRAPMYWNAARDNGTTGLCPGCALPSEGYPLGSLEEQREDVTSVYNYYREAIAIRNAYPVISHGDVTAETALNVGCISAQRKTWDAQECIILQNINDEPGTVDLSAYADWQVAATLSADGNPIEQDGTTLNMPAYGIAVLIPGK